MTEAEHPRPNFEVKLVIPGEMRWAMRAQGAVEVWIEKTADDPDGPGLDRLPAVGLEMGNPSELQLTWHEIPALGAWEAINEAAEMTRQALGGLRGAMAMRVEAKVQNPDTPPPLDT